MGTVYHPFIPEEAMFLATAFPQYIKNNGTNFPVSGLGFDQTVTETAFWRFIATNYGVSNPNIFVDLWWYSATSVTVSHTVKWDVYLDAYTANLDGTGDSTSIEAGVLAAVNTFSDNILGTTAKRLHHCQVTIPAANNDGLAAGDYTTLRISRDATIANDLTEDAILVHVLLTYGDT